MILGILRISRVLFQLSHLGTTSETVSLRREKSWSEQPEQIDQPAVELAIPSPCAGAAESSPQSGNAGKLEHQFLGF